MILFGGSARGHAGAAGYSGGEVWEDLRCKTLCVARCPQWRSWPAHGLVKNQGRADRGGICRGKLYFALADVWV